MSLFDRLHRVFVVLALWLACIAPTQAASYPDKPIRLIVPYAAGGLTDILARALAQQLSDRLGHPVLVENRTGAGGMIGADFVAKAAPDGYTLAILGQGLASVNTSLSPKPPYDALKDFTPLSLIARFSMVLVGHPTRPPASVAQLIEQARQHPAALSYGSAGNASTAHLTMALFNDVTGTTMLHVPFKGESPAFAELVGGRIDAVFATVGGALPLIRGGKLRAIAVADKVRSAQLPDVPTLDESGLANFEVFGWYAVLAPAHVPPEIAARLSTELALIGKDPAFRQAMGSRGIESVGGTPEEATQVIRDETQRWSRIIKKVGITAD